MHTLFINGTVCNSSSWDLIYKTYLQTVLNNGTRFYGRNGETMSSFGCSVTVDLRTGFPLTRLRKLPFKNIIREFLFDVGKDTNVAALGPAKHFWSFLADEDGNLGASAYNRQWRQWPASAREVAVPNERLNTETPTDQLERVRELFIDSPTSRHGTIITHNPTAINPACPPCHPMIQMMPCGEFLDAMVPARSNDLGIGFPLDIARYAIILTVMAKMTGFKPRYLYMPSTNSHIYSNCYDIVRELIDRECRPECNLLITRETPFTTWDDIDIEDFGVSGYDPHPAVKMNLN
jgi:thymidylate synthase